MGLHGIVLAAGGGTRLRPLTERRPKTMLEVAGQRSILELAVANLADAGLSDVTVVTGHAAEVIGEVVETLESRYEVAVHLRFNPRFAELNNAYSLWAVRDLLAGGALLVNGDTVHPPSVEHAVLAAPEAPVVLAIDHGKRLADEEMKVQLTDDGTLRRISKLIDPASAVGEYIGVARIAGGDALADALEHTWQQRGDAYYEDGFQEFADRGGRVTTVDIGAVAWVEVDDHDDLARAREVTASW